MARDFPRKNIISATLTSLQVEEGERLVSEEQSDEFQVFPAVRCPGHPREDEQRRFKADMQRQRGIGLRYFVLEFWILI